MCRHSRIIAAGQNNWTPRPPMSEARRQQLYGPLQPMDDKLPGDGDLVHIGALICMASAGLTLFTLWSIFG